MSAPLPWDDAQDAELARLVSKMGTAFDRIARRLSVPRTVDGVRYRWYTALGPEGQIPALKQAYLQLYEKPALGLKANDREWLRAKIAEKAPDRLAASPCTAAAFSGVGLLALGAARDFLAGGVLGGAASAVASPLPAATACAKRSALRLRS